MLLSKTIVVTGAASGIGKAICEEYGERGFTIRALDKDESALGALKEHLEQSGIRVSCQTADVCDPESLEQAAVEEFDIWVNNAGIAGNGEFLGLPDEKLRRIFEVNFFGVANGTRTALKHFSRLGKGTLVNIASVSGLIASPYLSAYSASKHAVVGLTRSIQTELKLSGSPIHVLLVSPGFAKTPLLDQDWKMKFPKWLEWGLGTPESIARAIARAVDSRKSEIVPTLNGKIMKRLFDTMPGTTVPFARALLSESLSDFLNRRLRNP